MAQPKLGVGFLGAGAVDSGHPPAHLGPVGAGFRGHACQPTSTQSWPPRSPLESAPITRLSSDALLDDRNVDVVAICSPHEFHAVQVIAACRAGKKAILCEKPFAMSGEEADEIAAVAAESGRADHRGCDACLRPRLAGGKQPLGFAAGADHTIRSSIVLPPNPRFEDFATEVITRPEPTPFDLTYVEVQVGMVRAGVVTLAIHDLPLIRALVPRFDDLVVHSAYASRPSVTRSCSPPAQS